MSSPRNAIQNYLNGNLSDACRLARRIRGMILYQALRVDFRKTPGQAAAIVKYLKTPSKETFDAACLEEQSGEAYSEPREAWHL